MEQHDTRNYLLPAIFALFTLAYFAPFYITVNSSTVLGVLYGLFLLCWVILFCTMWLYSLIKVFRFYRKAQTGRHVMGSCVVVWATYLFWFAFATTGGLITV